MNRRYAAPSGRCAWALAGVIVVSLVSGPDAAQTSSPSKTSTPPRTSWAARELQGVWRYAATIPLERPNDLAGRAFLTDEEVAKKDQAEREQEAKRLAGVDGVEVGRRPISESPIRGNEYNS